MIVLRPFYFFVVVWGKQFRDYLIQYCIPSLLSPDNIPALLNNQHNKFLICTTKNDWFILESSLILDTLKQYIEPVFIEIPLPPSGVSDCQHMGIGHIKASEMCFQHKAYGIALTPDLLLANGSLRSVQQYALTGSHVLLCAALRFAEEPFFKAINALGLRRTSDDALNITPRQLVSLSLQSFHRETETYDFSSSCFSINAATALWRLPQRKGMIIHTLSWCPILIDYGAIDTHSTSALEHWTMDGDYIYQNFKCSDRVYTCNDSDEIMLLSWSPLAYRAFTVRSGWLRKLSPSLCPIINRYILRETLENEIFDSLKLTLFPNAVRWHTGEIDAEWIQIEEDIQKIINRECDIGDFIFRYYNVIASISYRIYRYVYILLLFCLGSKSARKTIKNRLMMLFSGGIETRKKYNH